MILHFVCVIMLLSIKRKGEKMNIEKVNGVKYKVELTRKEIRILYAVLSDANAHAVNGFLVENDLAKDDITWEDLEFLSSAFADPLV